MKNLYERDIASKNILSFICIISNYISKINQNEYELRPSVTKGRMSKSARTHSLDCGAREFTKSLKENDGK